MVLITEKVISHCCVLLGAEQRVGPLGVGERGARPGPAPRPQGPLPPPLRLPLRPRRLHRDPVRPERQLPLPGRRPTRQA